MQKRMLLTLVSGMIAACGCQGTTACNDVTNATTDSNGNGFFDIAPPAGVEFDPDGTIKVIGGNTLVAGDLVPHAAAHGVDPNLVSIAEFFVRMTFDVEYANGATQTICQRLPFDEFELRFEAVCPEHTDMNVDLIGQVPFVGIPIAVIPTGLTLDAVDFECGDTVSLVTTKDESGEVV